MAAYRKSDGRRDDLCGGELRKHALKSWVLLFLFRCFCFVVFVSLFLFRPSRSVMEYAVWVKATARATVSAWLTLGKPSQEAK